MPAPPDLLNYIDANAPKFIQRLADAVAIQRYPSILSRPNICCIDSCSVSAEAARRPDVIKMAKWLGDQLTALGVETKAVDLGTHVMDGQELPLPPVILGKIGDDKSKKTVLIYGHFDVQPVWPFAPALRYQCDVASFSVRRTNRMVGTLRIPSL